MRVVFILLFVLTHCKLVSPLISLYDTTRWAYVTKTTLSEGRGTWSLRIKMHRPVNETSEDRLAVGLNLYRDEQWSQALEASTCAQQTAVSSEKTLKVPMNGTWSNTLLGTFQQPKGVHTWYFAISDCNHTLPSKSKFRLEVITKARSGSEFSYEKEGLVYVYLLGLLAMVLTLGRSTLRLLRRYRRSDDCDSRELTLMVSVSLDFTALLFQSLHLLLYTYNGYGITVVDFLSMLFHAISQLIITILLILISTGWTLKFREFPAPEKYVPVVLVVFLVTMGTVAATKITDDSHSKSSDFEGISGYLYLATRLFLWAWFLSNINSLRHSVHGRTLDFVLTFALLSSLYFLSMPCAIVLSWLHPPYQRPLVLTIAELLIQLAAFVQLQWLFTDKEGSYYRVSTVSEGVLPAKTRAD